jgi:lipopolysaccharide biosynthesis glycosyltransferase
MAKVTVALAADDGYARPLTVAAQSVIANLHAGVELDLCVLDAGIGDESRRLMEESLRNPLVNVVWVDSLQDAVAALPNTWNAITRAGYARLFLPEKLPDAERVLYLDCDTMARRDVSDLFDLDMGDSIAMGVLDVQAPYVPFGVPRWFEQGRHAADVNFNSGVLLIDLARWRAEDATKELLEYLTDGRHLRGQDQEAINAVCGARIGSLDPRWNQQGEIFWDDLQFHYEEFLPFSREELRQVRDDPWIVHFSNQPKPWRFGCTHPLVAEWFEYLDQTAFAGWRPPAPSYVRRQVTEWGRRGVRYARKLADRP